MFSFACLEHPVQCFLSSVAYDKQVATNESGQVFSSENRQGWEKWTVLSSSSSTKAFVLKNFTHGHFLTSTQEGWITTTTKKEHSSAEWSIQPSSTSLGRNRYAVRSVAHGKNLTCNDSGDIHTSSNGDNTLECDWNIEVRTGELCFLSSASSGKQIRCDPNGKLSVTQNKRGWEVWRFVKAANDGNVLISSWTHNHKYLCSNSEGHVFTTENPLGSFERWSVKKSPSGGSLGVVIGA